MSLFSYLKPPVPRINEDVSPLYMILVPHDNMAGVDFGMVNAASVLEATNYDWQFERDIMKRVARHIDVLQLAFTCKHASYHIEWKKVRKHIHTPTFIHNHIFNTIITTPAAATALRCYVYGDPSLRAYGKDRRLNRITATILAAYVGRPSVALLIKPREIDMNITAFAALSPIAKGEWLPSENTFHQTPLFWPRVLGPVNVPLQLAWWFTLAYASFKKDYVIPRLFKQCHQGIVWKVLSDRRAFHDNVHIDKMIREKMTSAARKKYVERIGLC